MKTVTSSRAWVGALVCICVQIVLASDVSLASDSTCNQDGQACILVMSPPVTVTENGQIVEGLRIKATNTPAILIKNVTDVVVRNVEIVHEGGHGISCIGSPGLSIENVSIAHSGARSDSFEENNIDCSDAPGITISNVRLRGGSAGIYLQQSPDARIRNVEGYDIKGPDPRGQLVQFDKSPNCLLEDFSVINDPRASRSADNISVYFSDYCIVRRGLLDGNNGPWSVGVMFENADHGLVEDVDTVAQGNGSFSAYPGWNVTFRRTRARDNICGDQGRGRPVSKALTWAGSPGSGELRIEGSVYFNLCQNEKHVWDIDVFDVIQTVEKDFSLRPAIRLDFPWE